jgi:hypothetical protein
LGFKPALEAAEDSFTGFLFLLSQYGFEYKAIIFMELLTVRSFTCKSAFFNLRANREIGGAVPRGSFRWFAARAGGFSSYDPLTTSIVRQRELIICKSGGGPREIKERALLRECIGKMALACYRLWLKRSSARRHGAERV